MRFRAMNKKRFARSYDFSSAFRLVYIRPIKISRESLESVPTAIFRPPSRASRKNPRVVKEIFAADGSLRANSSKVIGFENSDCLRLFFALRLFYVPFVFLENSIHRYTRSTRIPFSSPFEICFNRV